tara:strand:+ start:1510 stop:1713 length:204 start_codon:yes stop_codon:yes gene_type:complete
MKNTYIHEIDTIFAENNELILLNENQQIVINIDNFIKDLPSIIYFCKKEYKKSNKELFKRIENALKE